MYNFFIGPIPVICEGVVSPIVGVQTGVSASLSFDAGF